MLRHQTDAFVIGIISCVNWNNSKSGDDCELIYLGGMAAAFAGGCFCLMLLCFLGMCVGRVGEGIGGAMGRLLG